MSQYQNPCFPISQRKEANLRSTNSSITMSVSPKPLTKKQLQTNQQCRGLATDEISTDVNQAISLDIDQILQTLTNHF
jgi:hypothetical protein